MRIFSQRCLDQTVQHTGTSLHFVPCLHSVLECASVESGLLSSLQHGCAGQIDHSRLTCPWHCLMPAVCMAQSCRISYVD